LKEKGNLRAPVEEFMTQDLNEQCQPLNKLLKCLEGEDINPSLGDFMEREELAQVVVHRLLDTIDRLQGELGRKQQARRGAEAQFVNALYKCPTPPSPEAILGNDHHQIKKMKSTNEGQVNQPPNKESLARKTHRLPSRARENPKPNPPMKGTRSASASTRGEDNHPHHATLTRKTKAE